MEVQFQELWCRNFLMVADGIASCLTLIFCYGYLFVSLLPCSYHRLMVVRYCNKQEKFPGGKTVIRWRAEASAWIGKGDGCKFILGDSEQMGWGQPSSPSNTAWNASACCHQRVERGRANHPLRLPAEHASAEPRGGHTCHSAGGARNN